jgi:hypothetical protein
LIRRNAVDRKLLSAGSLLVIGVLLFAGRAPAQIGRGIRDDVKAVAAATPGALIPVLNPAVANKMAERFPLSPRLSTLAGKTIYMVDINWGGPEATLSVFEEIQAWFAKNMPSVKTVIKIKRGGYDADDPALWKEISDNKGDGVIVGISA